MQSTTYYHGYVTGNVPRPYELPGIPEDKLEKVKAKYKAIPGVTLTIAKGQTLQPAAAPRSTPTLRRNELPKLKTETKLKATQEQSRRGRKSRPIIELTTGRFFSSIGEAAAAAGRNATSVCRQLKHSHRHVEYRYATPDEVALQKMITL